MVVVAINEDVILLKTVAIESHSSDDATVEMDHKMPNTPHVATDVFCSSVKRSLLPLQTEIPAFAH
jgi:hypothetical protein